MEGSRICIAVGRVASPGKVNSWQLAVGDRLLQRGDCKLHNVLYLLENFSG